MQKIENGGVITYRNIDAFEIQKFQQNRYPLLFIDYVEEAIAGKVLRDIRIFPLTNGTFLHTSRMSLMFRALYKWKLLPRCF